MDSSINFHRKSLAMSLTELPDAEAQCAMAVRHARGDGVAQDLAKSLQWYTLAAEWIVKTHLEGK